jgi:hypothetical protein
MAEVVPEYLSPDIALIRVRFSWTSIASLGLCLVTGNLQKWSEQNTAR